MVLDYQWNLVSQTVTGNLQIQITFKFKHKHKTTTCTKVIGHNKTLPQIMSLHAKYELILSSLKVYCVYLSAFFLFHINVKGQGNVNVKRRLFLEDYLKTIFTSCFTILLGATSSIVITSHFNITSMFSICIIIV